MSVIVLLFGAGMGAIVSAIAAIAGKAIGRKGGFAPAIIRWGVPVALILSYVIQLAAGQGGILFNVLSHIYGMIFRGIIPGISLAAGILCLVHPSRNVYILALTAGVLGIESEAMQFLVTPYWLMISRGVCCILAVFLSSMESEFRSQGQAKELQKEKAQTQTAGKLILLSGPFAGAGISLSEEEEMLIGSDAERCQLILPDVPPCLCGVRWPERGACFWVTSYVYAGLLYEDGRPLAENSSVEAVPGSVFLDGQTGQALFRLE